MRGVRTARPAPRRRWWTGVVDARDADVAAAASARRRWPAVAVPGDPGADVLALVHVTRQRPLRRRDVDDVRSAATAMATPSRRRCGRGQRGTCPPPVPAGSAAHQRLGQRCRDEPPARSARPRRPRPDRTATSALARPPRRARPAGRRRRRRRPGQQHGGVQVRMVVARHHGAPPGARRRVLRPARQSRAACSVNFPPGALARPPLIVCSGRGPRPPVPPFTEETARQRCRRPRMRGTPATPSVSRARTRPIRSGGTATSSSRAAMRS